MIGSAESGKVFDEANTARKQKLDESELNIITGGASSAGGASGEFSEEASGSNLSPSMQTAAQMVGGIKGESGYEAGSVKDPSAIFREQNPEYVANLERKLASKLGKNPEAKERHDAMPLRSRTPQPGGVKIMRGADIPQELKDKYETKGKKPVGGQ